MFLQWIASWDISIVVFHQCVVKLYRFPFLFFFFFLDFVVNYINEVSANWKYMHLTIFQLKLKSNKNINIKNKIKDIYF